MSITTNARRRPPPKRPWRPRADNPSSHPGTRPRPTVIFGIKVCHTLTWLSIESCVAYVLYAGFAGRSDKRAALAAAVVTGETLVFAGNGFRCPLTGLAERYGAEHGSVTDIYLPKWFAHNLPAIHAPLLLLMAYLHARNLLRLPHRAWRDPTCSASQAASGRSCRSTVDPQAVVGGRVTESSGGVPRYGSISTRAS
jgi:hypothetical protein